MHNQRLPTATSAKREDLCCKRMTDAYMTYVYLEFAQRYGIRNYQVVDANIDDTILKHKTEMMNKFRERWAFKHRCDKCDKSARSNGTDLLSQLGSRTKEFLLLSGKFHLQVNSFSSLVACARTYQNSVLKIELICTCILFIWFPKLELQGNYFPHWLHLAALAKTAYQKWSQNARAFYSYGSQGFICNEIISHIPIAYRKLSQDARAFYSSYGSPGLHLEGNYFPHITHVSLQGLL